MLSRAMKPHPGDMRAALPCEDFVTGPPVAHSSRVPQTIEFSSRTGPYVVVENGDWRATLRQALPVLPRVLGSLRPTWVLPSVRAITPQFLCDAGIRALIWDVDGTLAHHQATHFAPEAAAHFERLLSMRGLRHAVVSNCGEQRFRQLAGLFPTLPVIKVYSGATGPIARVRTGDQEVWSARPAGELRPLRKPDPAPVEFALRALRIDDRRRVAMVGDQCLTDIASANLGGISSIKVPTLGRASCPPAVRVLQSVDAVLFHLGEVVRRRSSRVMSQRDH
jgi:HAD superfamily phosphatase (TIGR01668 family)